MTLTFVSRTPAALNTQSAVRLQPPALQREGLLCLFPRSPVESQASLVHLSAPLLSVLLSFSPSSSPHTSHIHTGWVRAAALRGTRALQRRHWWKGFIVPGLRSEEIIIKINK